jgi:putative acyl-CoA dehydrogenase
MMLDPQKANSLPDLRARARAIAQAIATLTQASLLLRHAPAFVAEAFCRSRLGAASFGGAVFGTLPRGTDTAAVLARAAPGP